MLQASLKVIGGKHDGKLISLAVRKFLVGREQDCQLRPNSDLVSRHHCLFTNDDYSLRLRDLGSTNGTFVNGKPLRGEVALKAGDRVRIGKLDLEVVIPQQAGAAADEPQTQPAESASVLDGPTVQMSGADTSHDLPVVVPGAIQPPAGEATVQGWPAPQPGMPQPGMPAPVGFAPPPGYPPAPYGQYPPGYPYQQPYQYPPPYGWGYPPGYGPPPGYAPTEGGPSDQQAGATATESFPAVRLPPPEETGAVPPPLPTAQDGTPKPPGSEVDPSNKAAEIIKMYRQRRT